MPTWYNTSEKTETVLLYDSVVIALSRITYHPIVYCVRLLFCESFICWKMSFALLNYEYSFYHVCRIVGPIFSQMSKIKGYLFQICMKVWVINFNRNDTSSSKGSFTRYITPEGERLGFPLFLTKCYRKREGGGTYILTLHNARELSGHPFSAVKVTKHLFNWSTLSLLQIHSRELLCKMCIFLPQKFLIFHNSFIYLMTPGQNWWK